MEKVKIVNFFNITKDKNESYQSFLIKLMAIWVETKYSEISILKDKILDNVHNDELRQLVIAAKEVDFSTIFARSAIFDLSS